MNAKASKIATLLAGAVLMVSVSACARPGETVTETQSVELGSAHAVRMHVAMGAGELTFKGNPGALLDANFTYNVADWKPVVRYSVVAGHGDLEVKQPSSNGNFPFGSGDIKYNWDLAVNNGVPLDLNVDMGAGTSDLDLSGMRITSLNMNLGAGDTTVDLSGAHKDDLDGAIKGGAGKTTVVLPSEVGVRVVVQKGIGSVHAQGLTADGDTYENAAYSKAGPKIDLTIDSGVGEVNLSTR